ncbi:hypothetical protein [Streptomyces sp. NPDC056549]|uniref:hypothetical protein n=1 Tax=Streptomyces sp. NPDC056549 TaxID=3345864 RepID=UPI003699F1CB
MIPDFTALPGRWQRCQMLCCATFTIVQLIGTTKDEPVNIDTYLSPDSFIP